MNLSIFEKGLPLKPLPELKTRSIDIPHAPKIKPDLNSLEKEIAIANALRYFPAEYHLLLAEEFARELEEFGHIYMYRFRPDPLIIKAHPIHLYPGKCEEAKAIQLMICNNLDRKVAQFPEELVTYGGNGQVFANWAQFWLVMEALSKLDKESTLVLYSGHPLGIFASHQGAPRMTITNGMLVPRSGLELGYDKLFAMGVTQYGQMTAGSFCYIGPQGIVHGTTLTLLNSFRRLKVREIDPARPGSGRVFLSSGLGGMSGAQAKAAIISGCVGVIAEISEEALDKRHSQGWLSEKVTCLDELILKIRYYKREKKSVSIGYLGNVVDVWEKLVDVHKSSNELLIDVGSDQTSLHNPFSGGYYPVGLDYNESRKMMENDPIKFKKIVYESLRRQVESINYMAEKGVYFFDYGNAFLLQALRAGSDVTATESQNRMAKEQRKLKQFRYQSYIEDIIGDIFSLGFGPFRWVCTSCLEDDLKLTDKFAEDVLTKLRDDPRTHQCVREQYEDNLRWIIEANQHELVVGSKARILYADEKARVQIARAFNQAIQEGQIKGPIVLSRDHHDVSGTDSPYRETSNIYDGSNVCADMSVQNVINGASRGATWVSLHNGGGVGWGEVINGGFGHVLDGSDEAIKKAELLLSWDVNNGIARRAWAGNENASLAIKNLELDSKNHIRLPYTIENNEIIKNAIKAANL